MSTVWSPWGNIFLVKKNDKVDHEILPHENFENYPPGVLLFDTHLFTPLSVFVIVVLTQVVWYCLQDVLSVTQALARFFYVEGEW